VSRETTAGSDPPRPKGLWRSDRGPDLGPLAGVRVIDVSTILAGPLAAQILGDFGADVIKIEHPKYGDPMRGHGPSKDGVGLWWTEIARNKRTMGLYLGDPTGAEIFGQLASTADVVIENFRPGTLDRWGVGWKTLHEANPDLVLVSITGFGQTGPYASRPGFGTLAEAMSGFAHLTGAPDGPPTLPAFGLADTICGIGAAASAAMALFHRDARDGTGQHIDMSILEPIMLAAGPGPTIFQQLGIVQERTGNRSLNNAPRNLYRTEDGHWVAVSTSANTIAERVLRLVGHPEVIEETWFRTGGQRAEHADELDSYVGSWIQERTRSEVIEAFEEAGAAVAPVYSPAELLEDPQVKALNMLPEVPDPHLGPVRMHNVLGRFSETPGSIRHTGRQLGADTAPVLEALGLSTAEIDDLRQRGVIA